MREIVDADRVRRFMEALGREVHSEASVYFVGGVTAVLFGIRASTLDVDLKVIPDDAVLRVLPELKETLRINVELASPDHFIPALPGWKERSRFIAREGKISFYHYDLIAQALAKVERGLARDLEDVKHLLRLGLVDRRQALDAFEKIEPELYRYPAIDPASFRRSVEAAFGGSG